MSNEASPSSQAPTSPTLFPIPSQLSLATNQLFRLIYWVDPLTSGLVLGCILLFCLLTIVQDFSAISLLSYLLVLQIVICFTYVNGIKAWYHFQGQQLPPDQFYSQIEPLREEATRERILELLRPTAEAMNTMITFSINIMRCSNNGQTIIAALSFLLLGWVARYVSTPCIVAPSAIAIFMIPLLYSKKHVVIDEKINTLARSIASVLQKVPFFGKLEKNAPGPDLLKKKQQ